MGFDVIGDIHGQAGKLEALLRKLGYASWRESRLDCSQFVAPRKPGPQGELF